MVLVNWYDPTYPKRIWCVFEAYQCKLHNVQVILAMSSNEEKILIDAMIGNRIYCNYLNKLFSSVDVESAKTKEPADQIAILQLIREYGVAAVNAVVLDILKAWILRGGEVALKSVKSVSKKASRVCTALHFVNKTLGEFDVALEWVE
jgi:hypothetical protein